MNPFLADNDAARSAANAVHNAVCLGAATIAKHPNVTRAWLTAFTLEVAAVLSGGAVPHGLRIVAWEASTFAYELNSKGVPLHELEDFAECPCGEDHTVDVAAVNTFLECASRGDHPAAVRTLRAVERSSGDDLDGRINAALNHVALILSHMADLYRTTPVPL